jgi:hypothetical protein
MRIVFYPLLLIVFNTAVIAQNAVVKKFDLSAQTLVQPELVGKAGDHYMLIDRMQAVEGLPLFILDSNKRLEKKINLPGAAANVSVRNFIIGKQFRRIYFSNKIPLTFSVIQVNGKGDIADMGAIQTDLLATAPMFITDHEQQRQLICSFHPLDSVGILFTGVILDSSGKIVKTLSYQLAFDQVVHQQPQVILDTKGNTHILFTERISSYHISTSVTVNTIPFNEEELHTESFRFERVKFNRLVLSDNPGKQSIQLQGFYYDASRIYSKTGLVSLQLPYERGKQPNNLFMPFPALLREEARTGLTNLRRKDDVMNSIMLNNIASENGETLLSFWARDVSESRLQSEYGMDKSRELNWRETASEASSFNASLKKIYERWLNGIDVVAIPPPAYRTSAPALKTNVNIYNDGIWAASDLMELERKNPYTDRNRIAAGIHLENFAPGKMNLVNFRLDSSGNLAAYSVINDTFFASDTGERMEMTRYPILYKNNYYFASSGLISTDGPFSVIQPTDNNGDPAIWRSSLVLSKYTVLSNPVKTTQNTYLWLVKNAGVNAGYSLLECSFE